MGDYGLEWPDGPIPDESKDSEPYYQEVYEDACDSLIFLEPPEKEEDARENLYDNAAILMDAYIKLGGVDDFYRFPAIAKLHEWTNRQQISKILSECHEAAIADIEYRCRKPELRTSYGMELMDVIHSAETALRMEFTLEEVNELRDAVEKKNRDRGYYGSTSNEVKDGGNE